MAEPKKYETKAGVRWRIQYRGPDRKPTTRGGFPTKKAANEWWTQHQSEAASGTTVTESAGRITLNALAKKWLADRVNLSPATARYYQQALARVKKTGALGEIWAKDIRQSHVRAWVATAAKTYAAKTVSNDLVIVRQVLDQAVTDRRIRTNPAEGVKPPKGDEKEVRPITAPQLRALADAAGEHYGVAVLALGLCGLRWGELAGLQAGDVDLQHGVIHVRRQLQEIDGKAPSEAPPKHGKVRDAPLPTPVASGLSERLSGVADDALVFPTAGGHPMRYRNARRDWFDPACEATGVKMSPHALRHTFAVLAIQAGADVKTIQAAMGHSSAKITLDRYGRWFPADLGRLNDALSDSFTTGCSRDAVTDEENQPAQPSGEDEQAGH